MHFASNAELYPLVRKLDTIVDLSAEEREAVLGLPVTVRILNADQDIVRDHDRPSQCCLILTRLRVPVQDASGWKAADYVVPYSR
jgi:hypothetical protein